MRVCSGAGCLRVVLDSVRYCDECKGIGDSAIRTHTYADRDRYRKLYGGQRWRSLARVVLHRFPICTRCRGRISEVADHIVPAGEAIRQAYDSRLYPLNPYAGFYILSNLTGLCRSCHGLKTEEDKGHVGEWPSIVTAKRKETKPIDSTGLGEGG